MLNNVFPFIVQAAVQAPAQTPVVPVLESASSWIDDEIRLFALGY